MNTFSNDNELSVSLGRRHVLRAGAGLAAGLMLPMGVARAADTGKTIEQRIQIASALEHYNHEQWKRAHLSDFYAPHQGATETCVLRQVQAAQSALNRQVISDSAFAYLSGGKTGNLILPDAFRLVNLPSAAYHSRESDFTFKAAPKKLPDTEAVRKFGTLGMPFEDLTVSQLIERGVNMGHIVVMAVESHVLHGAYAKRYAPGVRYSPATGSHAIRVLGLQKSSRNTITDAFIYDSSCPHDQHTRYSIGFDVLLEAYRGGEWRFELFNPLRKAKANFVSYVNSGVYLTEARVFPPLLENY